MLSAAVGESSPVFEPSFVKTECPGCEMVNRRFAMQRKVQSFCLFLLLVTLPAICQQAASAAGDTEVRVASLLKQLTLEEKIDLIKGVVDFYIRANQRNVLALLRMADGPVVGTRYG